MERLMQPDQLRTRVLTWADEEVRLNKLPPKANNILEALSANSRGNVSTKEAPIFGVITNSPSGLR
jgi:hypothetical protein